MHAGRGPAEPCRALALPCRQRGTPGSASRLAQHPQLCSGRWEGRLLASSTTGWRYQVTSPRDSPGGLPAGRRTRCAPGTPRRGCQPPPQAQPTRRRTQSPIALNRFRKGWLRLCGVFISKCFPRLSSQFSTVLLWDFLQLQAVSVPPARASSLIPQHANHARGGNKSHGLSHTWFP